MEHFAEQEINSLVDKMREAPEGTGHRDGLLLIADNGDDESHMMYAFANSAFLLQAFASITKSLLEDGCPAIVMLARLASVAKEHTETEEVPEGATIQ